MGESDQDLIDEIFNDLDSLMRPNNEEPQNKRAITLWVPEKYKANYEELQRRSNYKFGKRVKELLFLAIDRAMSL